MAWLRLVLLMLVTLPLAACELAGDILEAGIWMGALLVVLVVGVIAFIVAKIRS